MDELCCATSLLPFELSDRTIFRFPNTDSSTLVQNTTPSLFSLSRQGFYMCVRYTCVGMRRPEASLRSHPQNTLISFEIRSLIHLGFINGLEQLASKLQGLILLPVSPKHWESSIFFFTVLNKHTHFSSTDVKLI